MSNEIVEEKLHETMEFNEQKELLEFQKFINTAILNDTRVNKTTMKKYGNYSSEQIQKFLENPKAHERELRHIARYLENTSQIFKRIVGYLPSIAVDCPLVVPTKIDNMKKDTMQRQYTKAVKYLNMLSLPHELVKVRKTCFREDVFYGIEFETEQSYYIKQLDPDYCRISSNDMGVYCFEFDFSYFNKPKSHDCDYTLLEVYEQIIPGFFKDGYDSYKTSGWKYQWQEVPSDKSICIKLQEDLDYMCPPYASVYGDIDDIDDYKKLAKALEEQNNYRMIGFKMPLLNNNKTDKPDLWAVKMSTAKEFYRLARANVDQKIGLFMTPFETESISFNSTTTNDKNKVDDATSQLYDSLGFSRLLFNADSTTAMKYSVATDEAIIFKLNRQIERWITRKFHRKFNGAFKVSLLDVTVFSANDKIDQYLKLAQYGLPTVAHLGSLIGINQSDLMAFNFIENEILDVQNTFIPLSSSHTQTTDSSENNGRPTAEDSELTESGANTRENGSNEGKTTTFDYVED